MISGRETPAAVLAQKLLPSKQRTVHKAADGPGAGGGGALLIEGSSSSAGGSVQTHMWQPVLGQAGPGAG